MTDASAPNTWATLLRPSRDDLISFAGAVGLTALAVVGFRSSYGGTSAVVVGAVAALLGASVGLAATKARLPVAAAIAAAVGVYAIAGGVLALPEHAIAGIFPSLDTVGRSLRLAVTGWKELITTAPPVGRTGDLMVIPVATGFWSSFAAMTLASRLRASPPALAPPTIAHGLSIATGVNEPAALVAQGVAFGALSIAWLAWREHRRRPLLESSAVSRRQIPAAAGLLTIAFVMGQFGAGALPFANDDRDIWRQTVTPPFDPRQYPSPLAGYRDYVKEAGRPDGDDPVIFTIEGLPEDVPVRLATMDTFDGVVWQVSAGDAEQPSLADSGSFERVGAAIEPDFDGDIAEVTVTIGAYTDVWIPDVGEVIDIRFTGSSGGSDRDNELAREFRYNRATDTAASRVGLRPGDRYTMRVVLPPVARDLSGAIVEPDVPRIGNTVAVSDLAEKLATTELLAVADTGERLDRIRDEMREFGVYSDGDRGRNHIRSQAGHSAFRLTQFVQEYPDRQLVGNAEQYAAAYGLLFRDVGRVPTRVVMGFLPDEPSLDATVEVRASDVEAWVEVPVQQLGWVAVFPTPPRDQIARTSTAPRQPEPDYRTQNPPPPPLLDPEFENPATARGDAEGSATEQRGEAAAASGHAWWTSPAARIAGIALTPILLAVASLGAIVLLKHRRRERRRTTGPNYARISAGWREMTDFALDSGRPIPRTTTRRESAAFVGEGALALATRADEAVWSGREPTDDEVNAFWADLEDFMRQAEQKMATIERLRTKASVESLRARKGGAGRGRS